jgi:pimeloyl-ACP methyl ester carboxylesterase
VLGVEQLDLVGNDTGGAFAQALTVRRPDLVRSLTLTNCEARDVLPSQNELAQMVNRLAEQGQLAQALKAGYDDLDAARRGPFATLYQWPERFSDDDLRGIMEPHQASVEAARKLERFIVSLDAAQLAALEPQLRELDVPTLCVWGTGDEIFPLELAHWLKETIPGCQEIVEVDGGRLFWPFERGPELTSALRRFWAKLPSPA